MRALKPKFKQQRQQTTRAKLPVTAQKTPKLAAAPKKYLLEQFQDVQQLQVDESSDQQRLDNYLQKKLKSVPKSYIYKIIRSAQVRVNKKRAKADTKLQLGDIVRLPPVRISAVKPNAVVNIPTTEFEILYEDEYLLALNKPAGLAVHGGSGVSYGVIEQLRRSRVQNNYLELVHRLDRETSGVLLVAKKRSALVKLQQQFRSRGVTKKYLTMVKGCWPAQLKVIDAPLYKYSVLSGAEDGSSQQERRVKVVAKDDERGKRALSLVTKQQDFAGSLGEFSLLEVSIKTGRTHQIRVHLQSAGYPLLGDAKYGDFVLNKELAKSGLGRMFLHAHKLVFLHPYKQQDLVLTAELPPELIHFINRVSTKE